MPRPWSQLPELLCTEYCRYFTHFGLLLGQGDVGPVLGIKVNANEATDCIHQTGIRFSTFLNSSGVLLLVTSPRIWGPVATRPRTACCGNRQTEESARPRWICSTEADSRGYLSIFFSWVCKRSVIYSLSLQRNSIFPSDLEHDHREEEAPEHGAQLGGAHHPRPGEDEVVPGDHHQGHLHDLNHQL